MHGPASGEAAVAAAAHAMLVRMPPSGKDGFEGGLTVALMQVPDGAAKAAGQTAKAVMARPLFDERAVVPQYRVNAISGHYVGIDYPVLQTCEFVAEPWFMRTVDAVAPPPPPVTSERYTRDYNEVKSLSAKWSEPANESVC